MHSKECDDLQRIISKTYTLPQTKLVLITLLLLFFALFVVWRGHRLAVALACAAVFWILGAGWISPQLLHLVQRDYSTVPVASEMHFGPRTVIILLGGGTEYAPDGRLVPKYGISDRIDATSRLYHACIKAGGECRVILSGGNPQHHAQAEADNYRPYVLEQGVKPADMLIDDTSLDTYANAHNVAALLGPKRDEQLVLVTSAYHMPRALLSFKANGMSPQPFVSDIYVPRARTPIPRGRGFIDTETALHEMVGIARFYVWRLIGLY